MARLANFLILISLFSVAKLFNPISCSCTENPIHALFVFGDSLYDAGNKKYICNAANPSESCIPSEFWPYGRFNDDPNGRFSDGYIVPDFIDFYYSDLMMISLDWIEAAEFLRLPLIPPSKESGEFKCGANFAAAGAGVVGWLQQPMYLFQQVDSFEEIRSKYWPVEVLKNSIYLFAIGAGDYIQLVKSKNQSIYDPEWLPHIARNIVKDIEDQVMKIYNLGGRKFGFQNLAPLDLFPGVKQEINNDAEIDILKLLVRHHNAQLESALMALKGYEPYHELNYSILDYYGAIKRRFANPSKYGFNYVEDACCGIGIYNTSCSILNEGCCPAPSEYVFWDGIHNTHRANAQLARLFWEANQSVVTPVSLRKLISKPKPFYVHDEL